MTREAGSEGRAGRYEIAGEGVIRATLPLPPSTNNLYRSISKGGKPMRVKTGAASSFKHHVGQILMVSGYRRGDYPAPPIAVDATFWFSRRGRIDVSNRIKILEDAMCEYLGIDDSLVTLMTLRKEYDKENPRCEVTMKTHREGE